MFVLEKGSGKKGKVHWNSIFMVFSFSRFGFGGREGVMGKLK
jgi:hypothetical protein